MMPINLASTTTESQFFPACKDEFENFFSETTGSKEPHIGEEHNLQTKFILEIPAKDIIVGSRITYANSIDDIV